MKPAVVFYGIRAVLGRGLYEAFRLVQFIMSAVPTLLVDEAFVAIYSKDVS
jgi:hypothetical protein